MNPRRQSIVLALIALLAWASSGARAADHPGDGFALPEPGRRFEFPRDHGSHPEFRIEWWYITGHLWDDRDRRFGFQATFFRTAGPRRTAAEPPAGTSNFGTDHLFLAHFALLDVATGRFLHHETLQREGWRAGASTNGLHVWTGESSLEALPSETSPGRDGLAAMRLRGAVRAEAGWELTLRPTKPLVIFGTNGVSRKGAAPSAASHYLTFPRLQVDGTLELDGAARSVRGQAWMDHEFSSSQLTAEQAGWDWVSIQLNDGREIMAYRMRLKTGGTDPHSTLAWVDREGRVTHQPASAFALDPIGRWRSPRTQADYPLGFRLRARDPATGGEVEYRVMPLARDQELPGRIGDVPYWEGACRVEDTNGRDVGAAFVELTGYAGDLTGVLQ